MNSNAEAGTQERVETLVRDLTEAIVHTSDERIVNLSNALVDEGCDIFLEAKPKESATPAVPCGPKEFDYKTATYDEKFLHRIGVVAW